MKLHSSLILTVLFILSLSSLNYSERNSLQISSKRIEIRDFVKSFGAQLKEKDIEKLRPYFSEDCFAEFLKMSDSLSNNYCDRIYKSLSKNQYEISKIDDSTAVLGIGKRDVILVRTVGFFFIRTTPKGYQFGKINAPK